MNKYIPFLKLKVGEIGAVKMLRQDLKEQLSVFFEVPRKIPEKATAINYRRLIDKASKSILTNSSDLKTIYLDAFDVSPEIKINGKHIYAYVLDAFREMNPIPVIGIDRSKAHLAAALGVDSDVVCIRIQIDDFDSFELFYSSLIELVGTDVVQEKRFDLVFDCRYSVRLSTELIANNIITFRKAATGKLQIRRTIVCGSSIPVSISEILMTESEMILHRTELEIYRKVKQGIVLKNYYLGDYAIISALLTDMEIPPQMMQNVMTPRIIYPTNNDYFIIRGGALKSHPRGNKQYNDFCKDLINRTFYRGATFSWGDKYFSDNSVKCEKGVTPGSIIKPATNAHITYMLLR